jgi:hypothetical protein
MAGHPLLNQVKEKTEIAHIGGSIYHIHLSYHRVTGIEGYVAGLKFSDQDKNMDSSKIGKVNPFQLGIAIANKAKQMVAPDLDQISILGFYLLTDDLEARKKGGSRLKKRLYNAQALEIHSQVKNKLPHLTRLETDRGAGWAMSEHNFSSYHEFQIFERELAKQLRISAC